MIAGYSHRLSSPEIRNTGFPCLLRFIIWILFKLSPEGSIKKETYCFLLDHPRRCFTLLFPTSATWWLVGVLSILNFSDLFFFLILDLGNKYIGSIPVGYRILDGLFQVSLKTVRRLTAGGFHADDRSVDCQFAIHQSCIARELPHHDVHFSLPCRDEHPQDKRIRGKVPWNLHGR